MLSSRPGRRTRPARSPRAARTLGRTATVASRPTPTGAMRSRRSCPARSGARAFVQAMLDFERALASAQGDVGVIPQAAARVIAKACADLNLQPEALASEGKRSGSLAVPLVKALTEHVARADARAAAFVHYGSTSQDVLDTALVLCLKPCLADADAVLAAAVAILSGHARSHAGVVMLGWTRMHAAE